MCTSVYATLLVYIHAMGLGYEIHFVRITSTTTSACVYVSVCVCVLCVSNAKSLYKYLNSRTEIKEVLHIRITCN